MVTSRKSKKPTTKPYPWNTHITIFFEMRHGRDEIVVGTPLRFKYQRGTFKFIKMVHNNATDKTWIDCLDSKGGVYRSFYVDQLKGVVKPKRTKKRVTSV